MYELFNSQERIIDSEYFDESKLSIVLVRSNTYIPEYVDEEPWSLWAVDHSAEEEIKRRYIGRYESAKKARFAFTEACKEVSSGEFEFGY